MNNAMTPTEHAQACGKMAEFQAALDQVPLEERKKVQEQVAADEAAFHAKAAESKSGCCVVS